MNIEKLINKIICGDCIEKLKLIPDESIDLIYLDPPFFSNANYEVVWGNGAELKAFEDRWKGGINVYIDWMEQRVREMYRVLKPTGSIYLHCDHHAVHYLKIMMDKLFGYDNYRNDIIWYYNRWTNVSKNYQRRHDTILFYTKGNDNTFNIYEPKDNDKIYHTNTVKDDNKRITQLLVYDKEKFENHPKQKQLIDKYDKVVYVNDVKPFDDVWKISIINSQAKERLGYPTQKPEELLERIIKTSSNEGDIVLDPFVGGGTTCAVAKRLKRKYIGIDVSPVGCATTLKRLEGEKDIREKLFQIIDYPAKEEDLLQLSGLELQQWMMIQLHAKINPKLSDDGGIDGWFVDGTPIEVKKGSLTRGHVQKLHSASITDSKKKAVLIGQSVPRTVFEKVAELKLEYDFEVIIMTLQQVIDRDFKALLEAGIPVRDKTLQDYY